MGDTDHSVSEQEQQRQALRDELGRTLHELSARQTKLATIEEELTSLRYQLERIRSSPGACTVASTLIAQEAFRRRLQERLQQVESQRKECVAEVERAKERREAVQSDLEALPADEVTAESPPSVGEKDQKGTES